MVDMVRTRLPGHVFSPDYEFPAEKAALMQKICTKTEAGKPNIIELRGEIKYDVRLGRSVDV